MKKFIAIIIVICSLTGFITPSSYATGEKASFVVQLTRDSENNGHRKTLIQIDKVLTDIGENKLNIVVVAYESGIQALLEKNMETSQLLMKLANRGVKFKACRISMKARDLDDTDLPLEVEVVPAGAPEIIRLQMLGYKYWRP